MIAFKGLSSAMLIGVFFWGTSAMALDPAPRCEAGKLKTAGKYSTCRLSADSKAVKKGETPDYTKCEEKFSEKWGRMESKAGPGVCPSEGDHDSIDARITLDAAEIVTVLAGGSVEVCGDGVREGGEECDEGASNSDTVPDACRTTCVRAGCGDTVLDNDEQCDGEVLTTSCENLGFAGGQLGCTARCGFDTSGCATSAACPQACVDMITAMFTVDSDEDRCGGCSPGFLSFGYCGYPCPRLCGFDEHMLELHASTSSCIAYSTEGDHLGSPEGSVSLDPREFHACADFADALIERFWGGRCDWEVSAPVAGTGPGFE